MAGPLCVSGICHLFHRVNVCLCFLMNAARIALLVLFHFTLASILPCPLVVAEEANGRSSVAAFFQCADADDLLF